MFIPVSVWYVNSHDDLSILWWEFLFNSCTTVYRKKPCEEEMMDSIKKCAEVVNKSVIEQTAYIRASAKKKNLDLSKFEADIRRELNSPASSTSSSKYWSQLSVVNVLKDGFFALRHSQREKVTIMSPIGPSTLEIFSNLLFSYLPDVIQCSLKWIRTSVP